MIAALIGVLIGLGGAVAVSSVLETVLYEVRPRDPLTFTVVALALLLVCWLATYLPARRPVAANPTLALNDPAS